MKIMHSADSWVHYQWRSLLVKETASLVFLIMVSTLGLVLALLCTYVDVNCCYIQVITLISNGVHVTKGTYFNVT